MNRGNCWLAIVLTAMLGLAFNIEAQQVTLLLNPQGVRPNSLVEGGPAIASTVSAEVGSIVVISFVWPSGVEQYACEGWVIVSGGSYNMVDESTPNRCEASTEQQAEQAFAGIRPVEKVVFFGDPPFDDPDPPPSVRNSAAARATLFRELNRIREGSGGPTPAPTANQEVNPQADRYIHAAQNRSKCMHKQLRNWENGNNVHLWDCAAGGSEMKTWIYDATMGYIRAASNRSLCMHKQRPGWSNGNNVHLWACNVGSNEMKTWVYDEATGYIRAALNPDMCLHKQDPGWSNGNNVHLWRCDAGPPANRTWRMGGG